MIINNLDTLNTTFRALHTQAKAMLENGKTVEVVISQKRKGRTNRQNAFLHALFEYMSRFCIETGFNPLNVRFMSSELIKEYYKALLGVKKTSKLDTKQFNEFIDNVQLDFVEQTGGEYAIITPLMTDEQLKQYGVYL